MPRRGPGQFGRPLFSGLPRGLEQDIIIGDDCNCLNCVDNDHASDGCVLSSLGTANHYNVLLPRIDRCDDIGGSKKLIHETDCVWVSEPIECDDGEYRWELEIDDPWVNLRLIADGEILLNYRILFEEWNSLCENILKLDLTKGPPLDRQIDLPCSICVKPSTLFQTVSCGQFNCLTDQGGASRYWQFRLNEITSDSDDCDCTEYNTIHRLRNDHIFPHQVHICLWESEQSFNACGYVSRFTMFRLTIDGVHNVAIRNSVFQLFSPDGGFVFQWVIPVEQFNCWDTNVLTAADPDPTFAFPQNFNCSNFPETITIEPAPALL